MMNVRGALREAQRRWGASARVERRNPRCEATKDKNGRPVCTSWPHHPRGCPLGRPLVLVGRITGGIGALCIEASAETFEAAFDKVDRDAARARAKYCRSRETHCPERRCRRCKYRGPVEREFLGTIQADGTLLTTDADLREYTAREHAAADERCGHPWVCACGPCRIVRAEDAR